MRFSRSATALAVALPLAAAQTFTDCDPTKKSCPADTGLNAATFNTDFTQGAGANASWSAAEGTTITYGDQGAEFSIATAAQAPTIQTDFYIFFGRVEVKMKAAPGTGIVSSIVLESDDLDEIDWEFLGGNTAQVETNFFGKANTTDYNRAVYYSVDNPQNTFHTYTIDWTPERLEFIIDGTTVRTLEYNDPLTNGGNNYPQTPMRVKLGSWAAGGPDQPEGTVEWAGGKTDFSQAPFNMYVQSVAITNNNPGAAYEYGDMTGSWQSIKVTDGSGNNSTTGGNSTESGSATASSAAPTSSVSVAPVINSNAVVSTTNTGSAYSTNSASVAAQNSDSGSMTTEIASQPTATGPSATGSGSGSGSATGSPTRASGSASGTGPAVQTGTSGASANHVMAGGSLLGVALGFLML